MNKQSLFSKKYLLSFQNENEGGCYKNTCLRCAIGGCSFDRDFILKIQAEKTWNGVVLTGFKVGIVAACRGPMDFRMVRERAYDEGGTKRGCWTQLMFTYWRHVCRHGAVTRGPQTRAGGWFYFSLSLLCVCVDARVYMRVAKRGCVYTYMCADVRVERPEGRETGGAETTAVGCSCQILRLL